MSLMGTLAKVAIGIAIAKGVGSVMKNAGGQQPAPTGSSGNGGLLGDLLKQTTGGGAPTGSGGGLEDLLGQVLGGKKSGSRGGSQGGGLGDILEQLGGGGRGQSGGGLGDLLEGLTGNNSGGGSGGALGEVFGDFLKNATEPQASDKSFGDIFNDSLTRRGEPEFAPNQQQEAAAALMLRAMIQAAKSDGKFDQGERDKLLENLGDVSAEERRFVNEEMERPVDVQQLARQVPRGLEQQVYLMSVMGIDLDSRAEAEYLHNLATELGIGREEVNALHDHLGVPQIYS